MKLEMKTAMPFTAAASLIIAASANAQVIASDYFDGYLPGGQTIIGQTGTGNGQSPIGWESQGWDGTGTGVTNGDLLEVTSGRVHRALSSPITSGSVYIRTNMVTGTSFSTLELTSIEGDGDTNALRLRGNSGGLDVLVSGGGAGTGTLAGNDGLNHEWLLELNLDTGAGQVWLDGNTAAFDSTTGGAGFTASSGFTLNAINVGGFGGSPFVGLDDLQIARSWAEVGVIDVNAIPEPTSAVLLGLSGLALLLRRRK